MWRMWREEALFFGGWRPRREETPLSLIGVPLDETVSFNPGTRFAPKFIRMVSESLEWYSFYSESDAGELGVYDEGDITVMPGNIRGTLGLVEDALGELREEGRIPIMVGGEHTITLGAKRIIGDDTLLIVFDAHLDLRDEYLGSKLNHATIMRRLLEIVPGENVVFVGTRAACREELEWARKSAVKIITSRRIWLYGPGETVRRLEKMVSKADKVYVSIDMDVFDPAYAPGVGTPEPMGLDPHSVVQILTSIIGENLVGIDIVEANPLCDIGYATCALAARLIIEVVAKVRLWWRKK